MSENSTNTWRCQNQRIFLTYSQTYFDKKEYEEWLLQATKLNLKGKKFKFIRLANEKHKDGNSHMHVLIDFGYAFQTRNVRLFDYNNVHPNIKFVTDSKGWVNRLHYIGKEDPDNKDLYESSELVYRGMNANNALEAMALGVRPMDARIIKEECRTTNFELEITPEPDGPVYRHIQRILDPNSDLRFDIWRTVHWFYDEHGCSDKTKFAKYAFENKDYLILTSINSTKDFARQIENAVYKEGWRSKVLIVCLPRTFEKRADPGALFDCIEMAKDGIITANKYDSSRFRIRGDTTVIVLANCLPDQTRMTSDRWQIWHVGLDKSVWAHGKMKFYDGPDATNHRFPENYDGPNNQPTVNTLIGSVSGFRDHFPRENHEEIINTYNAFGSSAFPTFGPPRTSESQNAVPYHYHSDSSSGFISTSSSSCENFHGTDDASSGANMNLKNAPEVKLEISNDPNWINSEVLKRASAAVFKTPARVENGLFETWQG